LVQRGRKILKQHRNVGWKVGFERGDSWGKLGRAPIWTPSVWEKDLKEEIEGGDHSSAKKSTNERAGRDSYPPIERKD